MAGLPGRIEKKLRAAAGELVFIEKTVTSSAITTTAAAITSPATGRFAIEQIIVKTDATGLAGGTNFEIKSNNAKGLANIAVETVANLGANVTKALTGVSPAGDTTTGDAGFTVTAAPTVLETGKAIQIDTTSSVGTGAGTIDIHIALRRIDEGATIFAL